MEEDRRLLAMLCFGFATSALIAMSIRIGSDPAPLAFVDEPTTLTAVPAPTTASPASTSTTIAPTTTSTTQVRSATFGFTGDFLLHNRVNALARQEDGSYDYKPLLAPIASLIQSVDWAVCHMEVNLSADNQRLQPFPRFRVPGQIAADAKSLGYDSCTTASNHTLDLGPEGTFETLEVLDAAELHVTGTARTAQESAERPRVDVGGIAVAHLSYTYWFNGIPLPKDMPWLSAEIDQDRILSDAANAKLEGAEYVIVSLHWGEQYVQRPNKMQRELAPILAASPDVDLIIGHHAHVVQPIEKIGNTWVVYGLGNLLANYSQSIRRDELMVTAEIVESRPGAFETILTAVPLYVDRNSLVVYPASPNTRPDGMSDGLNAALDQSYERTTNFLRDWDDSGELAIN